MTKKSASQGWIDELFQRNDAAIAQVAQSIRTTWDATRDANENHERISAAEPARKRA